MATALGRAAERHGLVVILALGESIVSIGFGAAHAALSPVVVVGALLAVTLSLSMWWHYFGRLSAAAERHINELEGARRTGVATVGTYLHFGIVAGVLLASLGISGAIEHIEEASNIGIFNATTLAGGLALFFASTAAYVSVTSRRLAWESAIAAALTLALIPVVAITPPLAAMGIVVLLTLGQHIPALPHPTHRADSVT